MDILRAGLFAALTGCCLFATPLAAQDRMPQDRMPPIPADKLTEAQKKAAELFAEGRGYAVRGPFVPLIRSPEVLLRAKAVGDYLRFKSVLEPRLNEMVILITAREWTQQYEWNAHYPAAMKAGLRREIADGHRPAGMAEDEEIAYDVATEILRLKRVSDAAYRRAVGKFGEQGMIDLLGRRRLLQFPRHRDERDAHRDACQHAGAAQAVPGVTAAYLRKGKEAAGMIH